MAECNYKRCITSKGSWDKIFSFVCGIILSPSLLSVEELTDCDASSHQINYLLCVVGSKYISLVCLVQECSQGDWILDAVLSKDSFTWAQVFSQAE